MLLWLLISVILLGFDQLTKALILARFAYEGETLPIIADFFHFTLVKNSGAVFGIGGDSGWALYFFVATALIAALVFGIMLLKSDVKNKKLWLFHLSLALLIAGTLGNFFDRILQADHQVIDFIDFRGIWPYVFNIADMCLTVGITLFLIDQILLEPKRVKSHDQA